MVHQLQIALVQSALIWENPEQNRNNFSKKIATIPSDVDLIILPEMFTSGFTMTPHKMGTNDGEITLSWMQKIAKEKGAAVVGSIPFYTDGNYTNRLLFIEDDGTYHQYDKRHTFTLAGEDKVYQRGTEKLILEFKGFRICPLICYDLRFPVWARNTENYDVLVYLANWPKPRIAAWDALLKARAIENMAYCVGVNRIGVDENGHQYSGHSAVYDCLGEQLVFSEKEEIIYACLSKEQLTTTRDKLKFLDDRDNFTLLL